jgi:hypothetical protein
MKTSEEIVRELRVPIWETVMLIKVIRQVREEMREIAAREAEIMGRSEVAAAIRLIEIK